MIKELVSPRRPGPQSPSVAPIPSVQYDASLPSMLRLSQPSVIASTELKYLDELQKQKYHI